MLPTPDGVARYLLTLPRESQLPLSEEIARGSSSHWWLSEIDAAVPTIFAATQEKFVPQMINLEVLGGVDFKKGCYPGQEIVARSQYLGKLKRRMNIAHVDATDVQPAADVYHSDATQPIGTVVMAAASSGAAARCCSKRRSIDSSRARCICRAPMARSLTVRPLPYALFDPTE